MKKINNLSDTELFSLYNLTEIAQQYTLNEGRMGLSETEDSRKERINKTNRYLKIKQKLLDEIDERLKSIQVEE